MDDDPSKRTGTSSCVSALFQPIWIQRAVCVYNEAHWLLLDYLLNFLFNCRKFIWDFFANEKEK